MRTSLTSKTLWVNCLVSLLVLVAPGSEQWISDHPQASILVITVMNMLLRYISKDKIYLFGMLAFISACGSLTTQDLSIRTVYRRDAILEVNGSSLEGVSTIARKNSYSIKIKPRGNADLVLLKTCHREDKMDKQSSGFFKKENVFSYEYSPSSIEQAPVCPLEVGVFGAKESEPSWAYLDFEHTSYDWTYFMQCNGKTILASGVGVCQARVGTFQKIDLDPSARFAPSDCPLPEKRDNGYEFKVQAGQCLYTFDSSTGRIGRFTLIGYQDVIVRGEE